MIFRSREKGNACDSGSPGRAEFDFLFPIHSLQLKLTANYRDWKRRERRCDFEESFLSTVFPGKSVCQLSFGDFLRWQTRMIHFSPGAISSKQHT